jgi:hypothetical protein
MSRILITAAAMLVFTLFASSRPALAYGEHPWCAVHSVGAGEVQWECEYDSIEACRPTILSGNRGFCNPNPRYHGPVKRYKPRRYYQR